MKQKAKIIIFGNLLVANKLNGGGVNQCEENELVSFFDIEDAVLIHGDVSVESFDSADTCVVVTGQVCSQMGKGGDYAD